MQFYFIRHGQSVNNALWERDHTDKQRSEDPELTDLGRQQAKILADFIRKCDIETSKDNGHVKKRDFFGFTHLYSSLMIRSVETGVLIAEALGIPLNAWPEFHETGGIFLEDEASGFQQGLPGKPRSYFTKTYQNMVLPESVSEAGWWNRPFEADEERQPRARRVLDALLERHNGTDHHVAVVSHGGFYMHLMREIFGMQSQKIWFHMNNTGITRIDFPPDGNAVLIYHNRTDHLPDGLLT